MSSRVYAIHATCLLITLTYILMSIVTVPLFLLMIIFLLLLLCSLLLLLLFVLPASELYPAIPRSFFLILLSMFVIVQVNFLFLYLLRSYSIRYRYFQSIDLRSQGELH